ncbi:MAG TPA: regulatory protein RecX [Ignavibacteriaceae bacterium]|nr:regulatory protein RecX [Ignavibacteriaceae bacterium]
MTIERIVKRSDESASVFFDDQGEMILSYEVIFKNGLRKGDAVSESLFYQLKNENEKYFIKKKALNLIAKRVHSSRELQIKLLQKRFSKKLIDEVIQNLISNKIINDEAFAGIFVEEKSRTKHWGSSKLKGELIKRGIKNDVIEIVLHSALHDDSEQIKKLAEKKVNILRKRNYTDQQLKQKLFSFLLSKGFEIDLIKKNIRNLFSGNSEELID